MKYVIPAIFKDKLSALLLLVGCFMAFNMVLAPSHASAQQVVICEDGYKQELKGTETKLSVCRIHQNEQECVDNKNDRLLGLLPKWYKYLPYSKDITEVCTVHLSFSGMGIMAILPVGLAVFEMLLAVAGVVAVGFVLYGGFQYVMSQGEPDRLKSALHTIINALIGAAIAAIASGAVAFVGNRVGGA